MARGRDTYSPRRLATGVRERDGRRHQARAGRRRVCATSWGKGATKKVEWARVPRDAKRRFDHRVVETKTDSGEVWRGETDHHDGDLWRPDPLGAEREQDPEDPTDDLWVSKSAIAITSWGEGERGAIDGPVARNAAGDPQRPEDGDGEHVGCLPGRADEGALDRERGGIGQGTQGGKCWPTLMSSSRSSRVIFRGSPDRIHLDSDWGWSR